MQRATPGLAALIWLCLSAGACAAAAGPHGCVIVAAGDPPREAGDCSRFVVRECIGSGYVMSVWEGAGYWLLLGTTIDLSEMAGPPASGKVQEDVKPVIATHGCERVFLGDITMADVAVRSDPTYPILLKWQQGKGIVYLAGRGEVKCADDWRRLGHEDTVAGQLERLASTDVLEREAAAFALAWLARTPAERDEAIKALIAALCDRDLAVRRNAAEALGRLGDTRGIEPLQKLLADLKGQKFLADLKRMPPSQLDTARDQPGFLWRRLSNPENVAPEDIRRTIAVTEESLELIRVTSLGARLPDRTAARDLTAALGSDNAAVVVAAARAMAASGNAAAAELIPLLKHEADCVRTAVAVSLARTGATDAVPALRQARKTEADAIAGRAMDDALATLTKGAMDKGTGRGWQTGDAVFAHLNGTRYWYPGVIRQRDGERYLVQYADGASKWVEASDVATDDLKPGDRVFARWRGGGEFYPGRIAARDGGVLDIAYDDGAREVTSVRYVRVVRPRK